MEHDQLAQVKKYLDIIKRRKEILAGCFLFSLIAGLGVYLNTPKIYRSTAMIMFQQQKVNPTVMSPDEPNKRLKEMVATVSQQITSRTSLEEIIKQFDLYPELKAQRPMEEVLDKMRLKDIIISPSEGDIFRITFQGPQPKTVMQVTNVLASKFIEENLRFRGERASETTEYIKNELKMAKEGLDKKEATMRDYKLQYFNELRDQLTNNVSRLNALQQHYQDNERTLQELERTKIMIQEQIALRREFIETQGKRAASEIMSAPLPGQRLDLSEADQKRRELAAAQNELDTLQAKYTDKHPDVKRLQSLIETLSKNIAKLENERETVAAGEKEGEGQVQSPARSPAPSDMARQMGRLTTPRAGMNITAGSIDSLNVAELKIQLDGLSQDIERIKRNREEIKNEIKRYQTWVEAVPVREAEWSALTRDYDELRKYYDNMVLRGLQADSAESLEKSQRGSQFKVVDPAQYPVKPFKPDFGKIMLLAMALGLGFGGGISLLFEFLNTSFREVRDVEAFLGLPVLCALPVVDPPAVRRWKKIKAILWGTAFFVSGSTILIVFIFCWRKGLIII